MSLKRNSAGGRSHFGGGTDPGAKFGRQELYDELKRLSQANQFFAPVDIALAIGAGEPQVSRALLGLAAEGYLEKVEVGKYGAAGMAELGQAEFLKAFARASRVDSTRQRDLSEIARLKQNNDTMRQRLLAAIAEKDHYLAALKKNGIDPGPLPAAAVGPPAAPPAAIVVSPPAAAAPPTPDSGDSSPGPQGLAVPSPASAEAPSGPGDVGGPAGAESEGDEAEPDAERAGSPHGQ